MGDYAIRHRICTFLSDMKDYFRGTRVLAKKTAVTAIIILLLGTGFIYPSRQGQEQENFGMNLAEEADENSERQVTTSDLLKRMVLATVIVAGLGIAAVYLSRKVLPKYGAGNGRHIRLLETMSLGSGNRLALLEVENKKILIGSGGNGVSRISEFENDADTLKETGQTTNGDFD